MVTVMGPGWPKAFGSLGERRQQLQHAHHTRMGGAVETNMAAFWRTAAGVIVIKLLLLRVLFVAAQQGDRRQDSCWQL